MDRFNREWVHEESPEGVPSAAAYRLGCRCTQCKEANSEYMRHYRAQRVAQVERFDGTTQYHSHVGQPSKRTARGHLCIHPRCLDLAGLILENGVVINSATGQPDATFGAVAAVGGTSAEEALEALRKKAAS